MYFLLLVLGIPLNPGPDTGYKRGRFPKTLLEKGLKFVLNREGSTVAFNMGFVLLLAEIDLIMEKCSYKRYTLRACDTSCVKIILGLSTKVVVLYMKRL